MSSSHCVTEEDHHKACAKKGSLSKPATSRLFLPILPADERLCETTRMCHAGTSRPGVEVLLLLLLLNPVQSASANAVCRGSAALQNLSQPQYEVTMEGATAMGGMTVFIQSFLNTIQPNPFPKELILNIVQNTDEMQQMEYVREGLVYEIGFLVCAAIGILYIVLMPIVGFFLACCRCCGNCGGEMYQKQTSFIHCRRRTLYWSLFITTIIILAGNVIMFQSNEKLSVSIDQSQVELDRNIGNIHTYLTAVPQQIHHVVNESYRTVQEVNRNLDAIGSQLGKEIQERLRETLDSTLLSVRVLDRDAGNTSIQLNKLNSTLLQLQSNVDHLQANVTAVKNRINQTLSNPNCGGCASLSSELEKLTLDISISAPSLNEFQSAVDEVVSSNLSLKIKEAENYFDSIPQRVTNETVEVVQNSKQLLGDIKTQISQFGENFPLSALNNASLSLDQVQTEIDKVIPEVERIENIRWGVFLGVCCVVLLVVVCNFLGLILGPLGLHSKADPTNRSCTADCGGTFFMIGAGFSFLFCWLFMMIVLLLFLLGGNLYTLVCQPWKNGQLLMLIDTPGLVSRLEIGPSLGLKENINISDIYRDCEEDKSLWTTLHLYDVINLDNVLNVSKYSERIKQQFEKANITLTSIVILSPGERKQLQSLSRKTVDYDEVTQQLSKFYSINLNTTADMLDSVAAQQTNTAIRDELRNEARDLRKIQSDMEVTINPQLENVNSSIKSLRSDVEKINGTVGEVLSNAEAAQAFLDTNTTVIIKTESRTFLDCQMSYFTVFADWAKFTITQQVGRCGPVAGAVDSAEIVICSQMVDSLNAFWFSLGWCLIFFIPSIIFSIKLAKYYRKMKYSDQYE